ncbi:hypothetical protein AAFF_G00294610 [Aldrovandia affinis]|uniref:DUF7869 domain-containing protein n=1 Tax=Aldrovandia affinis TaxID=143900 RepID=A0AAD7R9G8_9TELE|nr:hypothetical protein AAFF_G00294610 [Aldrovandia affinis]
MLNLMSMLVSMGYFTQIEQKFMVSDHSFLPCDWSFATIEKRRKVSSLHTPDDMNQMILESRQQNAFRVMKMNCEDFRKLPDAALKRPAGLKITSMICVAGRAAPFPAVFQRQAAANRSSEESDMIITFNTAYNIGNKELPFTKCKSEIILMKKNGLNVSPTYSNDTACAQFIGVIVDHLQKKTVVQIADSKGVGRLRGMGQLWGIFCKDPGAAHTFV